MGNKKKKAGDDKTLAMRVLEGQDVPYEVYRFEYEDTSEAADIGTLVGLPAEIIYKTLVVEAGDPGFKPMLIMVSAVDRLNPKKVASAVGAKKVAMARHADAEKLTGLQTGGISPLALLNRGFAIYLDATALVHQVIVISAGQRGVNLSVPVEALLALTGAEVIEASG